MIEMIARKVVGLDRRIRLFFSSELQVVTATDGVLKDKHFIISKWGGRRTIRDINALKSQGYNLGLSVKKMKTMDLVKHPNHGPVPNLINLPTEKINSSLDMRDFLALKLEGSGYEIGAGASPFPVPIGCKVRYIDRLSLTELEDELYPGQLKEDLVPPNFVTDFENLFEITKESADFIIACHVIEHVKNPIKTIEQCYRNLKVGGKLLLVVPDMLKTFDSKRELTPLSHLIKDYQEPSKERDFEHYEEFYTKAFPETDRPDFTEFVQEKFNEDYSIHYHTFTYESFLEIINLMDNRKITSWSNVIALKTLRTKDDIEFYFLLTK